MKKTIISVVIFLCLPQLSLAGLLSDAYQEGIAYQRIVPEQPTNTEGDKIEVVELFWYGCPHCHRFEPFIERWLKTKSDNIEFVRLPAILRDSWAIHARAFYAAEALGVLDKIHKPLFTAIHAHKRKLNTEEALMAFFAEHGVSDDDFKKAFNSFSVNAKVRRANELGRRYGVRGTPAVVINGKYRTDSTTCKCGFSEVLNIVDFLAEKEQQAQSGN
jgi:thiol:disulfide interchange protein DsbA